MSGEGKTANTDERVENDGVIKRIESGVHQGLTPDQIADGLNKDFNLEKLPITPGSVEKAIDAIDRAKQGLPKR